MTSVMYFSFSGEYQTKWCNFRMEVHEPPQSKKCAGHSTMGAHFTSLFTNNHFCKYEWFNILTIFIRPHIAAGNFVNEYNLVVCISAEFQLDIIKVDPPLCYLLFYNFGYFN